MPSYRLLVMLAVVVVAVSFAYAVAQMGSAGGVGATATPAGSDAELPEVRLGGASPALGTAADGSTLPRLLAQPRSSAR